MRAAITLDAHTRAEWGRMAQTVERSRPDVWRVFAYACNRYAVGDRLSLRYFDELQRAYCAWLVFNEMPAASFSSHVNALLQAH